MVTSLSQMFIPFKFPLNQLKYRTSVCKAIKENIKID